MSIDKYFDIDCSSPVMMRNVKVLDKDLVDFAMRCPASLKLQNITEELRINENESGNKPYKFLQKTRDGKQILRDAMKCHIPSFVTRAEKQGFSAPDASWFKGESIEFVKHTLLRGDPKIYEFLDKSTIKFLVQEHLNPRSIEFHELF